MQIIQEDRKKSPPPLLDIVAKMEAAYKKSPLAKRQPLLVGASKGQEATALRPFIEAGLLHFGENRMQEAAAKWPQLRKDYPQLTLHLIGALQSNKAAEAVALFDVIETLDREKIAVALDAAMKKQGRVLPCFVQVNIGKEPQKAGVAPEALGEFLAFCKAQTALPIVGLMCVPPVQQPPAPYFALLHALAKNHGLEELSMGMSHDYETAIAFGATQVRVGTALFGVRG